MTTSATDLILHALTGIRAQIIAYHQMRAQAAVFVSGLAVAAAGFTLQHRDEARWVWAALLGPGTFLIVALFLTMYFRQLLDCCQAIEAALHDELQVAANIPKASAPLSGISEPLEEIALELGSAVHYHIALSKITNIQGKRISMRFWHDAPQKALIMYILSYLAFWLIWFRPWKLIV